MAAAKRKPPDVDPNVKIPASVLAAAAAADKLHGEVYTAPDEPPADPAADPAPVPAEPAPIVEPALPAPPTVAPEPAPTPVAATAPGDWEHRLNSMKGRVEQLERTKNQLIERNQGLEQVIATMAVTAPIPAPAEPAAAQSSITPEEREAYGDDFIKMARKIAADEFTPVVASLKDQVKILTDRLTGVGQHLGQTDRDKMHEYLDAQCPDWKAINTDQKFLAWIDLPAPYSNAIKLDLLKAAYAANNGPDVLSFFKGFLSEEAALAPQPEPAPLAPTPIVAAAKVPLESLAAPGRAKTAATNDVPAEKPTFTRAEISQFYVDVANGKWVGRETEKERIDNAIIVAGREGRIR